jgi:hypothetical protein
MPETLTQRARTWLTKDQPTKPVISKAHAAMLGKMQREPGIDRDDADGALDVLVEGYVNLGGDADDLLNSEPPTTAPVTTACNSQTAQLDSGLLVSYDDTQHTPLPTAQKIAAFAALKQSIGVSVQRTFQ